jgi:hypothetical protein
MRRKVLRGLLAGIVLLLAAPSIRSQELRYYGSVQYWTGPYVFTERTRNAWVSNGLEMRAGPARLTLSVPLAIHDSEALTTVGPWPFPTGGPDHGAVRARESGRDVPMGRGGNGRFGQALSAVSGDSVAEPGDYQIEIADPTLGSSVEVLAGSGTLRSIELEAFAKVPVTSVESGVGTGEWDYGAGAAIVLATGGTLLLGDLTYWMYGDMPDLELKDGLSYGAGVGRSLGERWSVLALLTGSQEIVDTIDPYAALTVSGNYAFGDGASVGAGLGVGLTEAAADVSLHLRWSIGLLGP